MPEEPQPTPKQEFFSYQNIYDDPHEGGTGFRAKIGIVRNYQVSSGLAKNVFLDAYVLELPNQQRVFLGSVGTPALVRANERGANILRVVRRFRTDEQWHEYVQTNAVKDASTEPESFVLANLGKPDLTSFFQESMPYTHSLGEAIRLIADAPDEILHPEMKRFKIYEHLAYAAAALEGFHSTRYADANDVVLNETRMLTHGDAGEYHLANYLTSANPASRYRLTDLVTVHFATEKGQFAESSTFTRQVFDYLISNFHFVEGDVNLGDIFKLINSQTLLTSAWLFDQAAKALNEIPRPAGHATEEVLEDMDRRYFLSYLAWRQSSPGANKLSILQTISDGLDRLITESPTLTHPALRSEDPPQQ